MSGAPAPELDPRQDFGAVYEAHYQAVYRAVRSVVLSPELAEDITQDAFVRAYRGRDRYQAVGHLQQWLCTIAIREAFSRLRRMQVQRRLAQVVHLHSLEPPVPGTVRDLVEEGMAQLSPRTRAVVVLFYEHGYRYREIAEILGIPEGTVGSRLSDGLRQMRKHLETTRETRPGVGWLY